MSIRDIFFFVRFWIVIYSPLNFADFVDILIP